MFFNVGSIDSNKCFTYLTGGNQYFRIIHTADDDTDTILTHAHVDGIWNVAFTLTYFSA